MKSYFSVQYALRRRLRCLLLLRSVLSPKPRFILLPRFMLWRSSGQNSKQHTQLQPSERAQKSRSVEEKQTSGGINECAHLPIHHIFSSRPEHMCCRRRRQKKKKAKEHDRYNGECWLFTMCVRMRFFYFFHWIFQSPNDLKQIRSKKLSRQHKAMSFNSFSLSFSH